MVPYAKLIGVIYGYAIHRRDQQPREVEICKLQYGSNGRFGDIFLLMGALYSWIPYTGYCDKPYRINAQSPLSFFCQRDR